MEDLIEVCLITTAAEIDSDVMNAIRVTYPEDKLFKPVIMNPERYLAYSILDGLIYHDERLCIPSDRTVWKALLTSDVRQSSETGELTGDRPAFLDSGSSSSNNF